ncbi:alkaline phosphatase D family protein [Sphingomonas sp. dw_22]|uniref:alkaline phosphatase D family protein n=1 Tax=Sphingomonas sp. dw_22 TaxID=2721175 RepID=UPI001BD36D90|nr:alkaline phosphatase D family protein [Sphingomonas sp. dw_22]
MQHPEFDRRKFLASAGGLALFAGLDPVGRAWAAPKFYDYPFALGVASGDPWPDGFVIWTRLAPQPLEPHGGMPALGVPVRWEVAEDERFARILRSGEAIARPELAHSVHVEVEGLLPARPYWYRFLVEGGLASPVGQVRTAPAIGALPDRVRLGLAGCQAYPQGWYEAYRHLSQEPDLDAVFHYGDYIYEYGQRSSIVITDAAGKVVERAHSSDEVYSLDDYRGRYAQYKTDPHLQAAHQAAAFITSFDDHEVDNNWVSAFDQDGTPPEAFLLRRYAAMQAWYENTPVRKAQFPRPDGLTMYRRLDYGSLFRMHVLDTRSYRSDQLCEKPGERACRTEDGPESTVMGAAQEAWLAKGLENDARWNLIAQQVRVMPLNRRAKDGGPAPAATDTWSGYPAARARLVRTITERKLTNVVIATGDSHIHNVGVLPMRDDELDGPAAATEFLGTSISSGGDGVAESATSRAYMRDNPHFALVNQQRGYQIFDITPREWRTDVKVMDRVQSPGGKLSTLARFTVTPDKPKLHRS